jgi:hypothetical protein
MTKWRVKDKIMDPISHRLHHGGIAINDWFSDKLKEVKYFVKMKHLQNVRFEVFTAVTMKNGVFWVVTPRGSCKNRRFGGTWRLLHQGDKNR